MLKHIQKLSVMALFSIAASAEEHGNTIRHPTCNIVLTDLNAHVNATNDNLIKELKQIRQFRGSQSRERIMILLEKEKNVNINAITANALTTLGYNVSFGQPAKKGGSSRNPGHGIYDRILKHLDATNIGTILGADSDYFTSDMETIEDMSAEFNVGKQAERQFYIFRFRKILFLSVELRIRNITNNIMETFYKKTVEVKVKNGDMDAAYERAVALVMDDAPNCELVTPDPEPA